MQSLDPLHEQKIRDRIAEEIESLIEEGEVREALQKLRLMAIDFAPESKKDATLLLSRINRYDDEKRTGRTASENFNDICHGALSLLEAIAIAEVVPNNKRLSIGSSDEVKKTSAGGSSTLDSGQLRRDLIQKQWQVGTASVNVVEAAKIERSFPNSSFSLGPISFELAPGEIFVVMGRNGSGKSTLLRIVAGLLLQSRGTLDYPLLSADKDWAVIRSLTRYIGKPFATNSEIRASLEYAAASNGALGLNNKRIIDDHLARYDLERFVGRPWSELSEGYLMRLELVRSLVTSPSLLILDEPLANLDILARQAFLSELVELTRTISRPVSIILSTHHLDEAELIADKLMLLEEGKCRYYGSRRGLRELAQGSIFHVSGNVSRSALINARIAGLVRTQSILGGAALHFNEFITIGQLLDRLGDHGVGLTAISDVAGSTKAMLI